MEEVLKSTSVPMQVLIAIKLTMKMSFISEQIFMYMVAARQCAACGTRKELYVQLLENQACRFATSMPMASQKKTKSTKSMYILLPHSIYTHDRVLHSTSVNRTAMREEYFHTLSMRRVYVCNAASPESNAS